jgi:coenzyme F420-dependent glucose-6-phosphate dehydrogenase
MASGGEPMVEIGYAISSEEHAPNDLVRYMQLAEEAGFAFAFLADHFYRREVLPRFRS